MPKVPDKLVSPIVEYPNDAAARRKRGAALPLGRRLSPRTGEALRELLTHPPDPTASLRELLNPKSSQ